MMWPIEVAAAGPDSGSLLASVEVRHLGGALHRSALHHGALDTLDCSFLTFTLGLLLDESLRPVMRAQLDAVADAFAPYNSGRRYLNLTEAQTDAACFYPPEVYARLRAVKHPASIQTSCSARTTTSGPTAGSTPRRVSPDRLLVRRGSDNLVFEEERVKSTSC